MAIDFTTAIGQVRLLISDIDESNFTLETGAISGFLGMYGISSGTTTAPRATVKRAAADALDAIATSEALVSKVIRTAQGVQTDGPKVATALREHAARLRTQANDDEQSDADAEDGGVDVIEFSPYPNASYGY